MSAKAKLMSCDKWLLVGIRIVLLVFAGSASLAHAQETSDRSVGATQIGTSEMLRAYGVLLTEGTNAMPTGPLRLRTYRIEEVRLSESIDRNFGGRTKPIDRVIRLTITGESFMDGNHTIWVDDEPVSDALVGRSELTTIIFDHALLEDGLSISVTRGSGDELRSTLPERIKLPASFRNTLPPKSNNQNKVRLRRIAAPWLNGQPVIEIELTSDVPYTTRNAGLVLQIGNQEIDCGDSYGFKLTCYLSVETFERFSDGDTIRVKYGKGLTVPSYQRFGRLDKKLLKE